MVFQQRLRHYADAGVGPGLQQAEKELPILKVDPHSFGIAAVLDLGATRQDRELSMYKTRTRDNIATYNASVDSWTSWKIDPDHCSINVAKINFIDFFDL